MDNNTPLATLAFNAVVAAQSSRSQSRWKRFWSRFLCFGFQKRDKRIAPALRPDTAPASAHGWPVAGTAQAGLALAPPSSPASFIASSLQSPANLNMPLSATSANVCSPPRNPMFTIGPYAHETQLVSPPAFSTFTTEPSTAPFTPPPELAHIMAPPSPDVPFAVPFARLVASSLEAKASVRDTVSPYSGSSLASPADIPAGELQFAYQLYPGSPVSNLVSPGIRGSGTSSPVPAVEFPVKLSMIQSSPMSFFPKFEPFTCLANNHPPCKLISLPQSFEMVSQQSITFSADGAVRDSADHEAEGMAGFRRSAPCFGAADSGTIEQPDELLSERAGHRAPAEEYRRSGSFHSRESRKSAVEPAFSEGRRDGMGNVRQVKGPAEVITDVGTSDGSCEDAGIISQLLLRWPEDVSFEDFATHETHRKSYSFFQDGELERAGRCSQSGGGGDEASGEPGIRSSGTGAAREHVAGKQRRPEPESWRVVA